MGRVPAVGDLVIAMSICFSGTLRIVVTKYITGRRIGLAQGLAEAGNNEDAWMSMANVAGNRKNLRSGEKELCGISYELDLLPPRGNAMNNCAPLTCLHDHSIGRRINTANGVFRYHATQILTIFAEPA